MRITIRAESANAAAEVRSNCKTRRFCSRRFIAAPYLPRPEDLQPPEPDFPALSQYLPHSSRFRRRPPDRVVHMLERPTDKNRGTTSEMRLPWRHAPRSENSQ